MKVYLSIATIFLSCALLYVARENRRLGREVEIAVAAAVTGPSACMLPPIRTVTMAHEPFAADFPRDRPIIILATDRNCHYCGAALNRYAELIRKLPPADALVYDGKRSYTLPDIGGAGIRPSNVLIYPLGPGPYNELLGATPTILLISRTGRVLGRWKGELTDSRTEDIRRTATLLLN